MGVFGGPNKVKGGIVFSLDGANPNSYAGDEPSPAGTDYGYFGGGSFDSGGNSASVIQRIDFNNDTATSVAKGNESVTAQYRGGTSSVTHGYLAGGKDPAWVTTVDRLDYSSDTTTCAPKGPLTIARSSVAGTHNSSYGYYGGGYIPASPNYVSTVDRVDYSNDTPTAVAKGPLTSIKQGCCSVGNQSYGYWAGGSYTPWPTIYSLVDRLDYSSDTTTTAPKGNVTRPRGWAAGAGNASYGYIGSGYFDPGPYYGSTMDRIDYSNDSATALARGPYFKSANAYYMGATGTTSYGYWAGDEQNTAGSTIGRLDYSNDTATAVVKGTLAGYMQRICGFSSRANANPTTSGTQTRSVTQTNGTPYGYFAGGYYTGPAAGTSIDRIDYSNDTPTAVEKGPLVTSVWGMSGSGSTSYGYFSGGRTGGQQGHSYVQRIDYSSDTTTAAAKGPLNNQHSWTASASTSSYSYVMGGYYPSVTTNIDRIDFSNDTATATAKGNLSLAKYAAAGTGNASYGYNGGGRTGGDYYSSVDRLDYSSDTTTCVAKGPLSNKGEGVGATGNASYGWFGGGSSPAPNRNTIIDRIDYSNDTATASARGNMGPGATYNLAATGNTSYGYIGGGRSGGQYRWTTIYRIDYSNDTPTTTEKGPLDAAGGDGVAAASSRANALPGPSTIYPWYDTSGKGNTANITDARFNSGDGGYFTFDGTGDYLTVPSTSDFAFGTGDFTVEYWVKTDQGGSDYGYFVGGSGVPSPLYSTIDRVDFSNDTPTATAKGPLNTATYSGAATGNTSYGYFGGGSSNRPGTAGFTTVDRIDYSSDTSTAAAKGPLTTARSMLAATGNASYGYWAGGYTTPGNISLIDRVDYSSDTPTAVEKGPLSSTRGTQAAVGNSSYAYFVSGIINWPTSTTIIDRVDYSNDTATALVKGNLGSARRKFSGTGNASYGYVGAGAGPNSDVHRLDYASDTSTAVEKGPLTSARYSPGATGNTSYGYWGGGYNTISTVDRVDFSNDTPTASARGPLSLARDGLSGVSSRINGISLVSAANIINPDSETGSGYWAHQYDTTFDWNSEYGDGSSLGTNYGYITGGSAPSYYSTTNRIDFASDTGTTPTKGPLSAAKGYHRGMSSTSYGYFGGGYHPSAHPGYSTVDRLDYSSDTPTMSPKGQLARVMVSGGAAGNTSYGYIGGGSVGGDAYSTVNRVDYGNDTATALAKGPLSAAETNSNTTGNLSYAYWGAGYTPPFPSTWNTNVDRLDYSNDSSTASPKGPLTQAKEGVAATGNASYGYFCGGYKQAPSAAYITTVDRVDYSNDTATAVSKGPLTLARRRMGGATGTTAYGYIGGGETSPGDAVSTVDRIDYSSDTDTASPKGPLSDDSFQFGTVSSRANGFPTTSSSTELYTCALSPLNDGSWHHVVMTRKGGTQQTYYDGVGITTTAGTYTDGTNYSGVDGWYIGKGGGTAFSGNLANITIRKGKGLSSDEVQQNFNAVRSRFGV